MKNILIAASAVLALSASAAVAQDRVFNEVGVSAGELSGDTSFGARAGITSFDLPYGLGLEATYDGRKTQDVVGLNLVAERQLSDRVGGYVLGGLGYSWNERREDSAVWTYGAGLTYALTPTVELDLRVREYESFEDDSDDTAVTLGVNYVF